MKVLHIGLDVKSPPTGLSVALKTLGELVEINTATPNLEQEARKLFDELEPNLVFMQLQAKDIISHHFASYMKERASVYNWTGDVRSPLPQWYCDLAPHITATLFTNETDVSTMRKLGYQAHYLNIGFDETIYNPHGGSLENKDIVFLGNNYQNHFPNSNFRFDMAVRLKQKYGSRFGVYGSGWNFSDGNYMGNQQGEAAVYRGAKIAINCNHINLRRYSSDRNLRIMGSGAFCLAEWYEGIDLDFTPDKHLVTFNGIDDLLKKCDYYLENDTLRKYIAGWGCEHIHSFQTWKHMIKGLKKIYKAK